MWTFAEYPFTATIFMFPSGIAQDSCQLEKMFFQTLHSGRSIMGLLNTSYMNQSSLNFQFNRFVHVLRSFATNIYVMQTLMEEAHKAGSDINVQSHRKMQGVCSGM